MLVPFVISMSNRFLNRLAAHQRLLLAPTFESRLTLHLPWPATTLVHAFSDTASLIALLVACWGGVVAHPIVLAMSVRWWQAATDLMPLNGRIRRTNPWRWRAGTASGIALTEYERRLGKSLLSHCDHVILPQPGDQSQPVMLRDRLHLVSFADLAVSACALAVTCRPRLNFAGVRAPEAEAFVPLKVANPTFMLFQCIWQCSSCLVVAASADTCPLAGSRYKAAQQNSTKQQVRHCSMCFCLLRGPNVRLTSESCTDMSCIFGKCVWAWGMHPRTRARRP